MEYNHIPYGNQSPQNTDQNSSPELVCMSGDNDLPYIIQKDPYIQSSPLLIYPQPTVTQGMGNFVKPFQLKKKEILFPNLNIVSGLESPVEFKPVVKKPNRTYREVWRPNEPMTVIFAEIPDQTPAKPTTVTSKLSKKQKARINKCKLTAEIENMKSCADILPDHDLSSLLPAKSVESSLSHQHRLLRFSHQLNSSSESRPLCDIDLIVGTCGDLEKDYFRITSEIDPAKVRPERVLRKSLELVKEVWDEEGDYCYVSDQLKSIRQDLTVQGIRNNFSVSVYDAHSRISLIAGDYSEFGQCLTQLRSLVSESRCDCAAKNEFTCYYILNCIFTEHHTGLMDAMAELRGRERNNEYISAALALQRAHETVNYSVFFKTYRTFPGLGKFIIDWFVDRFRVRVLSVLCRTYRPTLAVEVAMDKLGFCSYEKCVKFLVESGVVLTAGVIDCKKYNFV